MDFATRGELIAARMTVPEVCRAIGADSLGYLSVDGLFRAVDAPQESHCFGCFSGRYPIDVQLDMDKLVLEKA